MDSATLTPKSLTSSSSSAAQQTLHSGIFLLFWYEAPKETVLPARGRAAEAGKREAEVEGTAAVMAMAAGTPTKVVG